MKNSKNNNDKRPRKHGTKPGQKHGPRPDRDRSDARRSDAHRSEKPGSDKPRADQKRPGQNQPNPNMHAAPGPKLARAELYGFHAVAAAWLNPARKITALYVTQQGAESFKATIEQAGKKGLRRPGLALVEKQALESALPQGAVHQGLALVCAPLEEVGLSDITIKTRDAQNSLVLILDQVTDPHNVGAILRSACAFGADGLIMQKKYAPELSGPAGALLAKTACGAIEHMPVAYETNLSRSIEELQEAGYFVYGLDERGETGIGGIKKGGKVALVLGAEGPGIRHLVKEHCDALIRLPMHGPMPSINVSNAAAVALYALSHK